MDGTHIGIRNVRERIEKMCGGKDKEDDDKGGEQKFSGGGKK